MKNIAVQVTEQVSAKDAIKFLEKKGGDGIGLIGIAEIGDYYFIKENNIIVCSDEVPKNYQIVIPDNLPERITEVTRYLVNGKEYKSLDDAKEVLKDDELKDKLNLFCSQVSGDLTSGFKDDVKEAIHNNIHLLKEVFKS